jgi:hypothetical protein
MNAWNYSLFLNKTFSTTSINQHMKNITLFLAASILFLGSCTIQKRVYRPGFTVEWKSDKFQATETEGLVEENLASTGVEYKVENLEVPMRPLVLSKENKVIEPAVKNTTSSSVEVVTSVPQQEKALAAFAKPVSKKVKKETRFTAGNAFEESASISAADGEGNTALTAIGWVFIIIGIIFVIVVSILLGILLMLLGLLFFVVGKKN